MAKKTAAAVKVVTKTKEVKLTIGAVAIAELTKSQDAEKALAAVKAKFPDGNTKMASIYWYASQEGIKLQKAAKPKAEKVVHKVAVPAKKSAKKPVKATVKVAREIAKGKAKPVAKAPAKGAPPAGKISARKPVDAEAEAADKAASAV